MSDLISRKAAIDEINDLLKSPYAHSRLGAISEEDACYIRKEMAGTIIDLCLKAAKTVYDVDKVVEKLDKASDHYECENAPNGADSQMVFLEEAIDIVRGGGIDE